MTENRSLKWIEYIKVNGEVTRDRERIITELELPIIINGRHFVTAMITPMLEKEFVVGYLFSQGIIDSINDIESLEIDNDTATIILPLKEKHRQRSLKITSDFKVEKDDIFKGVDAILHSKIYEETGGVHSAGLFKRGAEPVCIAEDVGRHNALDKVIGYALMKNIDFSTTFATSTGRMVSDMVSKICMANIPIVATKTAVAQSGVEMGQSCGVTIIGFVRERSMNINSGRLPVNKTPRSMRIYTNPERIIV
jgi:FdhD protein